MNNEQIMDELQSSFDSDYGVSQQLIDNVARLIQENEKLKAKIKDKIKSLELECELCNVRNLIDCETQCTIGSNKKCLKELMEVDNE